jgi:purine-binding chemotaxis protein CheW
MTNVKQNSDIANAQNAEVDELDYHKYVVFRLGGELYGTQLLSVREVVEELPIKRLPNTIQSFKGVCNLRGQIVGVIDLSAQFKVVGMNRERPVLLVFDSENGALAVEVDHIEAVTIIPPEDIETHVGVLSTVENKFIHGIGKLNNRLVTLIDLRSILSHQQLLDISISKIMPKAEAG